MRSLKHEDVARISLIANVRISLITSHAASTHPSAIIESGWNPSTDVVERIDSHV
jgi:hypothetical protein